MFTGAHPTATNTTYPPQAPRLRQLVGSRHGAPQRHPQALLTVVEAAFVEDHKERVQNGGIGLAIGWQMMDDLY